MVAKPKQYNNRDVLTLLPVSKWTPAYEAVHKEYNRIFQSGFATRSGEELIENAKLTGEDWITDFTCPTLESALFIHIAKEMVLTYAVNEDNINDKAHEAYKEILERKTVDFVKVEADIQSALSASKKLTDVESVAKINKENDQRVKEGLPAITITPKNIKAIIDVEHDKQRKKVTNEVMSKIVKEQMLGIADSVVVNLKPVPEKNKDYCFLGAAGSGKSTISRQFLGPKDKDNSIILATDNYRAFTMPGSNEDSKDVGKNVFAKTQDLAYMVKELVMEDLQTQQKEQAKRPNIIFDGVTLGYMENKLLNKDSTTSAIAAYAPTGFEGIAERADYRARDEGAAPADKGRFVHTTSLLQGHASASARLLTSLPSDTTTEIHDTDVERGAESNKIGEIDTKNHVVEIDDLKAVAEFLNKQNINQEAINQIDLIYPTKNPLNLLATHPENKAKAVIDLVLKGKYKPDYTVKIKDKITGTLYAELKADNGKVKLDIIDSDIFYSKAKGDNIESTILRSITRQLDENNQGIEASLTKAFDVGDKPSFDQAYDKITAKDKIVDSKKTRVKKSVKSAVRLKGKVAQIVEKMGKSSQKPLQKANPQGRPQQKTYVR